MGGVPSLEIRSSSLGWPVGVARWRVPEVSRPSMGVGTGIGKGNSHKEPLGVWLSERAIASPVENIIVVSNMLPFLFIGTGIGKCNATRSL